jgi:5-methylcytosine-specific restriction endonuclease McrA
MPNKVPMFSVPRPLKAKRIDRRPSAAERGYCDAKHKAWRLAVLNRDAWQCRVCGRVCGSKREAHADHVSPVVVGTDYCEDGRSRYDVAAGQCLCVSCHGRKTEAETRTNR